VVLRAKCAALILAPSLLCIDKDMADIEVSKWGKKKNQKRKVFLRGRNSIHHHIKPFI